jgi:acyl carrier protein
MTKHEIYTAIDPVFRELFDQYEGPLSDNLTAHDVEQWDSLGNVQLVVAIEQVCNIHFAPQEVSGLPNLGALVDLIATKTAG